MASYIRFGDWAENLLYDHAPCGASFAYAPTDATLVYDEMTAACGPVLASTTATVDETGTIITVEFTKNIKVPQAPQDVASLELCKLAFTTYTLSFFGTGPTCEITGALLKIYVGYHSTFSSSTKIQFRQNLIYTQDCMFPLMGRGIPISGAADDDTSDYYIAADIPAYTVTPTITLEAVPLSSICENLTVNVTSFTGMAKRAITSMTLECVSAIGWGSDTGHSEVTARINSFIHDNLSLSIPFTEVTIPASLLTSNLTYTFVASITNFQSQVATATVTVVISPFDSPRFTLEGVSRNLKIYRNNTITATVFAAACDGSFLAKGCEDFAVSYGQTTPMPEIVPASKLIVDSCARLLIPAGTLKWDTDYHFIVKAIARVTSTYYPSINFTLRASRTPVISFSLSLF